MESYYETQNLRKWYIWAIFLVPAIVFTGGILSGALHGEQQLSMLLAGVVLALLFVLFWFTRLETRIDPEGITIRYFPFQRHYHYVQWSDLEKVYVRTYKPLAEYGGWGLRYSLKNGKAFNISGKNGLQLVFKNGKKILIGTANPDGLQTYLLNLGRQYNLSCIESNHG